MTNYSIMNLDLSEEQRELLQMVDRACKEIRPIEERCYLERRINDQIIPIFRKAHLLALPIDEEYGGQGADLLTYVLALERIGQEGASVRTFFSGHISIGMLVIQQNGTEEQKQKYLPPATRGDYIMAFALTEPNAGSDPASLQTTYEDRGDHYLLRGSKQWISNGTIANVITAYARKKGGNREISAFIVESGFPGYRTERHEHKMGLVSSDTGMIYFDDCIVPKENLLGREGKGLSIALQTLMNGRLSVAAGCVGVIQDCLAESVHYARERIQHGKPIGKHQLVQRHIGRIATGLEASRYLVYKAALAKMAWEEAPDNMARRDEADTLIAQAKYFASNACFEATHDAVQVHGGNGFSLEYRVARHACDNRVCQIYEGTNEILEQKIAIHHLGKAYAAYR